MKLKQKKIIKTPREQRAQATRRRTAAKARRVEKTQEEEKDEAEEKVATCDGRAKTDIKEHGSTASLNLYKYYASARTETLKHVHNTQLPPAPPRGMAALIKSTRHQKLYFATQLAFLFLPLAVLGSAPALLLFDQTEPAPAPAPADCNSDGGGPEGCTKAAAGAKIKSSEDKDEAVEQLPTTPAPAKRNLRGRAGKPRSTSNEEKAPNAAWAFLQKVAHAFGSVFPFRDATNNFFVEETDLRRTKEEVSKQLEGEKTKSSEEPPQKLLPMSGAISKRAPPGVVENYNEKLQFLEKEPLANNLREFLDVQKNETLGFLDESNDPRLPYVTPPATLYVTTPPPFAMLQQMQRTTTGLALRADQGSTGAGAPPPPWRDFSTSTAQEWTWRARTGVRQACTETNSEVVQQGAFPVSAAQLNNLETPTECKNPNKQTVIHESIPICLEYYFGDAGLRMKKRDNVGLCYYTTQQYQRFGHKAWQTKGKVGQHQPSDATGETGVIAVGDAEQERMRQIANRALYTRSSIASGWFYEDVEPFEFCVAAYACRPKDLVLGDITFVEYSTGRKHATNACAPIIWWGKTSPAEPYIMGDLSDFTRWKQANDPRSKKEIPNGAGQTATITMKTFEQSASCGWEKAENKAPSGSYSGPVEPRLAWALFWSPRNQENLLSTYQLGMTLGNLHNPTWQGTTYCPNAVSLLAPDFDDPFAEVQMRTMAYRAGKVFYAMATRVDENGNLRSSPPDISNHDESSVTKNCKARPGLTYQWALVMPIGGQTQVSKGDLRVKNNLAGTFVIQELLRHDFEYTGTHSVAMAELFPKNFVAYLPFTSPGEAEDHSQQPDGKKQPHYVRLPPRSRAHEFWEAFNERTETYLEYHAFQRKDSGLVVYVWGGPVGRQHWDRVLSKYDGDGASFQVLREAVGEGGRVHLAGRAIENIEQHRSLDLLSTNAQEATLEMMLAQQGLQKVLKYQGQTVEQTRLQLSGVTLTMVPNQATRSFITQQHQQNCYEERGDSHQTDTKENVRQGVFATCGRMLGVARKIFIAPTGNPQQKIATLFHTTRENVEQSYKSIIDIMQFGNRGDGEVEFVSPLSGKNAKNIPGSDADVKKVLEGMRKTLDWQMLGWLGLRLSQADSLDLREEVVEYKFTGTANSFDALHYERNIEKAHEKSPQTNRINRNKYLEKQKQAEVTRGVVPFDARWFTTRDTARRLKQLTRFMSKEQNHEEELSIDPDDDVVAVEMTPDQHNAKTKEEEQSIKENALKLIQKCPGGFTTDKPSPDAHSLEDLTPDQKKNVRWAIHQTRTLKNFLLEGNREAPVYCLPTPPQGAAPLRQFLVLAHDTGMQKEFDYTFLQSRPRDGADPPKVANFQRTVNPLERPPSQMGPRGVWRGAPWRWVRCAINQNHKNQEEKKRREQCLL
ncbi:unnamed protein product [Amoebophrya sp. A120]|nr:unnamed protein product [Amoebophrya sp. A120]|eukprot:GSA120T00022041001.1